MTIRGLLVVLFACLCATVIADEDSSSSSSEGLFKGTSDEALSFVQGLVLVGYIENKLDVISDLLESFSEDAYVANLTLIGSQNVYNPDGSLKEIRTIELALPYHLWTTFAESDFDFDPDDNEKLKNLIEKISQEKILGLNMDFSYKAKNELGEMTKHIYLDSDTYAFSTPESTYINQTIEVKDRVLLEERLQSWRQGDIPISVLYFDKVGKFLANESRVVPELLINLADDYGAPKQPVIKYAQQGLAMAFLSSESKEDVPNKLRAYMEEQYPSHKFIVTLNSPDGQYINKDYSVTLEVDFAELEDLTSYNVYGYDPNAE